MTRVDCGEIGCAVCKVLGHVHESLARQLADGQPFGAGFIPGVIDVVDVETGKSQVAVTVFVVTEPVGENDVSNRITAFLGDVCAASLDGTVVRLDAVEDEAPPVVEP